MKKKTPAHRSGVKQRGIGSRVEPSTKKQSRLYAKRLSLTQSPWSPKTLIIIGISILVIILIMSFTLRENTAAPEVFTPIDQASNEFNPLVPSDVANEPTYMFDPGRNVLSFTAQYQNVDLTVSQQSLPDNFQSGSGDLADLARQIDANHSVESNKGQVYIADNPEGVGQLGLFAANDEVLVFVRTNRSFTAQEWREFVDQLN